jgi:2-keto-4-pentenoate hydratase/2-oxohepta-3-ene-1,7-dioic acid hydratase in catechol pathway
VLPAHVGSTTQSTSRYLSEQYWIYTGTPGQTSRMDAGDIVEVEIEGVGILRNPVKAE